MPDTPPVNPAASPSVTACVSQEAVLGRVLDALHCGAALGDREGRILHVNARLAAMAGRPAGELVGEHGWSLLLDRDGDAMPRSMLASGSFEGEALLKRDGREPLPVVVSARIVDDGSAVDGYRLATVIDISEARDARHELQEQYDAIAELSDTVLSQAVDLKHHNAALEAKVRRRTKQLADAQCETLQMLAVACESRDEDTGEHVRRVQVGTERVARRLGFNETDAEDLGRAATLHDVGKIHVPDAVLLKPGKLTDDERRVIQGHTLAGEAILGTLDYFAPARRIARHHHEDFNGGGYPDGLAGDAIPIEARIVHVVDVYDALTHARPYKDAWPADRAAEALRDGAGVAFDPAVVAAFLADPARV